MIEVNTLKCNNTSEIVQEIFIERMSFKYGRNISLLGIRSRRDKKSKARNKKCIRSGYMHVKENDNTIK